ncbi:MAG TPA: alanine racemase [Armatimonadota bacterium]|jgi:alanine racemase|nr:alanine racemase [Armatimonadota bacterium]
MMHQAWVEVDLDALRHNVTVLKRVAGPNTLVMPVIKANAYGHGLVGVAHALAGRDDIWGFAVARGEEALLLRDFGVQEPILTLGVPPVAGITDLARHGVTIGVGDMVDIASVKTQLADTDAEIDVHLKVDTGMCRMGVDTALVPLVVEELAEGPAHLRGIYSHFATAEEGDLDFAEEQLSAFRGVLEGLEGRDLVRHMANSAGLCRVRESRFDVVRAGAILYGVNPGVPADEWPDVRPTLRFLARVAAVKRFPPGSTVGYGRRFEITRPSAIATILVGYADGYPRQLSGKAEVLIRGKRAPVVGAVNMDSINVDVTDLGIEQPGDEVVLIGTQGDNAITVEELAERADTVVHEIPTRLGPRLPRVYLGKEPS